MIFLEFNEDMVYYKTLQRLHQILKPKVYLEVGVRNGESLQYAYRNTICIGIDPEYEMKFPYNERTLLFKETSDKFFEKNNVLDLTENKPVDFAFIDGMHLFDYVLRDFINIEKVAHKNSIIVIHDVIPKDEITSSRERTTDFWTGDVWKIIPILQKYRPDLKMLVLDSEPSGLCTITNLDRKNDVLEKNYKEIVREYLDVIWDYKYIDRGLIKDSNQSLEKLLNMKEKSYKSNILRKIKRKLKMDNPKCLGVLLCYNDGDILEESINYMFQNNHDLIVWDHGSNDNTKEILDKYNHKFIERKFVPRTFDFYNLYGAMSQNLIDNYIERYDWISWPDQDEFLEGPDRRKNYYKHLIDVYNSRYNWIRFNNINYWFTEKDDTSINSPVKRVRYYSPFIECAPRIRSWRASVTNIREFNHNVLEGEQYPRIFNLRHYSMRTKKQLERRINKDRAGLRRGDMNVHYDNMKKNYNNLIISSEELIYDNGKELSLEKKFDWQKIYG